jgi:hypothetical protein
MMRSAEPKKPRGRPATGKDPMVGVRLPTQVVETLDAWAQRQGLTRSAAIRRIFSKWFDQGQ